MNGWRLSSRIFVAALTPAITFAQQPPPPQDPAAKAFAVKMGRGEGRLKPGDPAPDFSIKKLRSEERIRLSGFAHKKPVALVFGSYT